MTPSPYQQAIYDALQFGQSDIQVNAVAGSGKTTTLQEASKQLPYWLHRDTLMTAFNSHIAKELQARQKRGDIPRDIKVKTIHSLGYGVLRQAFEPKNAGTWVDEYKYQELVKLYYQERIPYDLKSASGTGFWEAVQAGTDLISKAMLTLTNPDDRMALEGLVEHFGIVAEDRFMRYVLDCVPIVMKWGREGLPYPDSRTGKRYHPKEAISFDDMIYLPIALNLRLPRFKRAFIDEVQDLNRCQQELLLRCTEGGVRVFVGDPFQSIYGFMGADVESFHRIQSLTEAKELPLSVCYRCARRVVELAAQIVPQIEAAPGATDGIVEETTEATLIERAFLHAREGRRDPFMLLCRVNAPLVSTALEFIRQGVPAKVRGKDIGVGLGKIVDAITEMRGYTYAALPDMAEEYFRQHEAMLKSRRNSALLISNLRDRVDCVLAVYEAGLRYGHRSAGDLRAYIQSLFSDDTEVPIILSSIHKAKGLESRRVGILQPDLLPHPKADSDWEKVQETNLAYVAITRAKEELYLAGKLALVSLPAPTEAPSGALVAV